MTVHAFPTGETIPQRIEASEAEDRAAMVKLLQELGEQVMEGNIDSLAVIYSGPDAFGATLPDLHAQNIVGLLAAASRLNYVLNKNVDEQGDD